MVVALGVENVVVHDIIISRVETGAIACFDPSISEVPRVGGCSLVRSSLSVAAWMSSV